MIIRQTRYNYPLVEGDMGGVKVSTGARRSDKHAQAGGLTCIKADHYRITFDRPVALAA